MDRSSLTFSLLVAAAFMDTSQAQATECFTMFDAKNALVYQSTTTPINLSGSISDQMTRFFPSRYLVISDVGTCAESGAGSGSAGSDGGSGGTNGPAVYGADATSRAPVSAPPVDAVPVRRFSRASAASRR